MTLVSPYQASGQWLRGNLHTHTTNSDGKLSPDEVVDRYAEAGHDFLSLSDHDHCSPRFERDGLLCLRGVEVTAGGPHLLAIGVDKVYDTHRPRAAVIAEIMADGALCVLNHPNWEMNWSHWDQPALEALGPYHGIEIWNTVIERLPGEAYALDRWDRLLTKGRRLWGYANDDFHDRCDGPFACNVAQVDEATPEAVLASLKAGRFYASTGVTLDRIAVDGATITVAAPDAALIRFIARGGAVKQASDGPEASYTCGGDETYVRVECWGAGRRGAFTQPVFVEKA
jgi:hypothetical protein